MNLKATIPAALLAGLMVLSIFACCSGATAEATPPTWEEGDAWATGFERDLGAEFADEIANIEQAFQGLAEIELEEFEADGNVEMYVVFEVSEETSTHYILTADMGQKLLFSLEIEVTAMLPDEGTYETEPSMSEKTIALDVTIDYALWTHAEILVEKDTMAIDSISIEVHGSAIIEASITNFPSFLIEETESISYENIDVWMSVDVDVAVNIDFDPALDIFQFPFDVGDEWTVESTATITGTLDGFMDATGLPEEATQELFNNDIMVANLITGFPIEFDQLIIDEEDGPQVTNGVMEAQTVPIEFDMECVGVDLITLPNYGQVHVYILEMDGGQRFNYSSDVKFMTSMDVDFNELFGEMGTDFDLPVDMDFMEEFDTTIGSVEVATAQNGISEIAEYQGGVSEEADNGPGDSGDANDFFFKEPYFGMIILVLVAVIVISVAFAAIKRK